jgi:ribosomal-protein-alanine N-acetyltransferase
MFIRTARLLLRDFVPSDRATFVAYQIDRRYGRLYDIGEGEDQRVHELFDLFVSWQQEMPRRNFQVGVFERNSGRLCGCAGIRKAGVSTGTAVLGIEFIPDDWGRYRLAVEVAAAVIEHGFSTLHLHRIVGAAASGNKRVGKLARWFGAEIVAQRPGPQWMIARGWTEVDWSRTREGWSESKQRRSRSRL